MTVQGASGRTWLLRALLAVGGGLLAALVSVLLSAAPAHASPSAESDLPTVLAPVTDATGVLSDAVVTPVVAPVADVLGAVAGPLSVVVTPAAGVVGAVASPVPAAQVTAPVVAVITPVADALTPVGGVLEPVLRPVTDALVPVVGALEPVTRGLRPVTDVLVPVVGALEPVTGGLRPVTDVLVPDDGSSPGAGAPELGTSVTVPSTAEPAGQRVPALAPTTAMRGTGILDRRPDTLVAVHAPTEVAPGRAPHRPPNLPGADGVGLPPSGSTSTGAARGAVDGDVPSGVQPPALRGVTTRGSPSPAPPSAPGPEVPDSPA
ncbi:hypothetical protein [Cellulomonas sp. Root137]|uniref:hypothetical protein n=1 Tax=Cellulomonas sp. Root137 TaxID=1736459 RepID=UPI0006FF329B|nr:hypothetical protein [Cellulomonas sp. Root137]KQY47131.1 hypothetical protein ASD18_07080 [Cellulomonas sp. Root137]